MADVDLRKLSKKELIKLIQLQTDRAERLENELAELEDQLREDNIEIDTAGSITDAAKIVESIFEDAEAEVAEYLENIRRQTDSRDVIIRKAEAESRSVAKKMIDESEERCRIREREAREELRMLWAQLRGGEGDEMDNLKDLI